MRAVVQRVSRASVTFGGAVVGAIGPGLVVLLGVGHSDTFDTAAGMAEKILRLRVFADEQGKMNRSLLDSGGALLAVSQFTLYGDVRRGLRPGFDQAAPPEKAAAVYEEFVTCIRSYGVITETGIFRADMSVNIVNEGPVTILLDSEKQF
jgi:D-tyrosyl-tRNA(Tyr) deacylase